MSGKGNISWFSSSSSVNGSSNYNNSSDNSGGGGGWTPFATNKGPVRFGGGSTRKPTAIVTPFGIKCNVCGGNFRSQQDFNSHLNGDC